MFGRTGQMFPRPRAYHDAIYEEEYGSETEEDCCRGRGISAIVCWLLSVIVLIGVAVAVVLTVFFVLRSRSPASTLEDLTTIFDNDLTFSSSIPTSVPAAAASDEVPPNSGSSSFEDDWGASTSSTSSSSSSTRSIFANSGHSSRKPTVYVDSSEIRQGGHRNNNNHFKKTDIFVTHHQKPGFEAPSATTPVRESSSNTNGKVTTRRYYSDTTGQAVEDVISKTTSLPPNATTPERNSAQSNSDERVPSASESVEAIKKHSSQFFSEESSNSFQNHFPTTKPPSEAHGTTLFTAAPSSGPKTTNNNNNKRGRVKGNTKPFVLYPNNDTPNSSSEETFSASSSTTEAPAAESNSSEETPQAKKIPSGFRPSNFVDPTTLVTTSSPTTRVEDMLTRIIMRNKNTGTATTRRYSQPTTTPSTLESQEEPETTRRPGKMRTVVHRTTTTTQPPNIVLVTPSADSNLIDRSSEEEPSQFATTVKTTTARPKLNDSSENIMDILVGSEDSKTLITKETDRGVITSAILPPWYQSDRDNESPEEITKPNKQRETSSKNDDHGLFRQPDLTALLDILSSSEGKPNLTSETYKNEMQTEASSKAERIKNIEDELKPVFVSGASETEREGMPVRHGSAATGFHFNGAGDTKTNIYGFFPDDLEGEESSEQLHVAPAPNHMVHPRIPTNKKDYDDADTSDGEDHVIDIAYDSKLNPEIQVEVEQSSEEDHHHQHHHHNNPHGIMNGYGHREPLHSTEVDNPPPTPISHPDLEPPTAHQILPPFTSKAKPSKGNIEAPAPSVASAAAPTSQELPIAEISVEAHEDDGDFGTRSEERQPSGYGGNVQETRPVMKFHNEPQHHHHFGELPSASESTNVVQSPPSSEEERFDDTRKAHGDWSQKSSEQPPAPGKNFTQSHVPQNSLEEYSEEDPNYHYGTSLEEHLERLNTSTTTPPPTTTTTTSKPRTKIVEVYAQPYSPTHEAPTSTTPAPAYDDYYSNESPESNKTRGFVPPEPINFHDNQNNFASPEYTSKSGWRPLTFNHRKGSGQTHNSNTLMTPGGQGVRAPSTRPVELLQSPQRPRPPRPDLQPPTSSEEEQPQGPPKFLRPQHQQQQQDNTWTGIPSANVLPNTVQKLPTRMKFPSDSSPSSSNDEAPRPTIKVPQHQPPPQPLRHRTQMHIDRNKYLQRPAVPPIIMRRLPQIQQNPIQNLQNTRGPPETSAQPSSVPPPPPPPPHSSPPVVVTVPVSRRPIVQHRGPHQYLPPQRHQHNQGPPPQQTSSPSGSIQWPSEDQHREHQQRQQSLLDQRLQQQQNIIRRNSQYLLNQRRHQG